jgi:hypothetical protein
MPAWVMESLRETQSSGLAEFIVILKISPQPLKTSLLCRWYVALDRFLFLRADDAAKPEHISAALPDCKISPLEEAQNRSSALHLDILYDPLNLNARGLFSYPSHYGTWSIRIPTAFREVTRNQLMTNISLDQFQDGERRSLKTCVVAAEPWSVSRSQNNFFWKAATLLLRQLRQLSALKSSPQLPDHDSYPGNLETCGAGIQILTRYISHKWYREQWSLAYQWGELPINPLQIRPLVPPKDRFWADPFLIRSGDEYLLFHEEAPFSMGIGYIVLSKIDRTGKFTACVPILKRDYHLSYPFLFQWDNQYFMVLETASRNQIELYRATSFPLEWTFDRVLLRDVNAACDPTIVKNAGRWWLFTNMAVPHTENADELYLFYADSPLGPWKPHEKNPIKSDVRSGRSAGAIFEKDASLYRPAQDGSQRYGYAVSINKILRLTPEEYEETEVQKILPDWHSKAVGVHTYTHAGDLTVVDWMFKRPRREA